MYLLHYVKDCKWFAEQFPYDGKGSKLLWVRNVLYCNAQPKYFSGRLIGAVIRHILDPITNLVLYHRLNPCRKRR